MMGSNTLEVSTLVELLRQRAFHQGDRLAYSFLLDGEKETASLTYQELDHKSRAIGAVLQQYNGKGERAILLYPAGLEYIAAFFGCLYSGVIAVPAYPPDPARLNRTLPRLQLIIKDAQPQLVLTTSEILSMAKKLFAQAPDLAAMRWIATDKIDIEQAEQWQEHDIDGSMLAFLQYTSGSTGSPKGVMVSHKNMLSNADYYKYGWEHTPDTISLTWMPTFHDLGLMDGLIQPLYSGFHSYLMSAVSFLQKPLRWLQAITRYRISYTAGPNFSYELCVRKVTDEQRLALDLRSWKATLNAAEPVRKETMERFFQAFKDCGFLWNVFNIGYGLAEATLKVTAGNTSDLPVFCTIDAMALEQHRVVEADGDQAVTIAGCGRVPPDRFATKIVIVNPETLCQTDGVGEVWVSGPGIAQGYWMRPEESKRTLQACLADTGEGPFLRTGDLGFLKDGELFITGRLKDLIIIRGANHYPHDIEWTVEKSHQSIRPGCTAAFSIISEATEQLVIVAEAERRLSTPPTDSEQSKHSFKRQTASEIDVFSREMDKPLDTNEVISTIQQAVSEYHDLATYKVVLIKPGSIFKTSSGKIQRHACRKAFLEGSLSMLESQSLSSAAPLPALATQPAASSTVRAKTIDAGALNMKTIKTWIVEWIAEKKNLAISSVDSSMPFTHFGLDSMVGVMMAQELQDWVGRPVPATIIWDCPSIESIAHYLTGEKREMLNEKDEISRFKQEHADMDKLLMELEQISEDKAQGMLYGEGRASKGDLFDE